MGVKCKTLDKKEGASFRFQLSGMWEVLDKACTMKGERARYLSNNMLIANKKSQ